MAEALIRTNAAVLDPMGTLTAGERTLLCKLDRKGPAHSLGFRKGWMLDGTRYTDKALQRFIDLRLARFWRDAGGVWLGLNQDGALAAYRITPQHSAPAERDDDEIEAQSDARPPEDD